MKNTTLIINWPLYNQNNNIINILKTHTYCVVIVIGDIYNRTINKRFVKLLSDIGYMYYEFNVKQISWLDYYYENKTNLKMPKSSIMVFTTHKRVLSPEVLESFCNNNNLFYKKDIKFINEEDKKLMMLRKNIKDLAIRNKIPLELANISSDKLFYVICTLYYQLFNSKQVFKFNGIIPKWINTYKRFIFFYVALDNTFLPKQSLISEEMFKKFYKPICDLTNIDKGLEYCKKKGIVPNFITTNVIAAKYIFLSIHMSNISTLTDNISIKHKYNNVMKSYTIY